MQRDSQTKSSLHYRKNYLADTDRQKTILSAPIPSTLLPSSLPSFREKVLESRVSYPLRSSKIEILQVNTGYLCNQTCSHCHVDAGPDRKEIMTREVMKECLRVLEENDIESLDITGGAPEMHPHFREFIEEARKTKVKEIIVRSNLSILLAHKKYADLPDFFKKNHLRIISSLPCYLEENTDSQRGNGVFQKSIEALKRLNSIGYGRTNSSLKLDLVHNPIGPSLPGDQNELEREYKNHLKQRFGIEFHELFTLANLPISRFLEFLLQRGLYQDYMTKLINSFNPKALTYLMCKNTISVDYTGRLYDCDFNQMLSLPIASSDGSSTNHIRNFHAETLQGRSIATDQHCFGCTAGMGSSCQGATVTHENKNS